MATLSKRSTKEVQAQMLSIEQVKDYQFADGTTKPEYRLTLKKALSDGTTVLNLSEPNIGAIRKSRKCIVKGPDGEPDEDSAFDAGIALLSSVTGINPEALEGLKMSDFIVAQSYLGSFVEGLS
jgi:hypothetical protein